ncbi:MAG: phosphate signaling complex protein PhoU [Bacillota bacterium]|nr:phosphate signaling complex protein PhoU [Bacillota bacterium]
MRNKFDTQLEALNNDLISMGALCEDTIACAVKALMNNDMQLAEKAIKTEKEIDQKERDIEALCLKLLLQQQPVAKDLRMVSSALKMITDMGRIGDQAADIAEIVTFINLSESINNLHIAEMAEATIKMVTESIDAFVKRDLKLANSVIDYDDVVDDLFLKTKNDLIYLITKDKKYGEQALDLLMIAKYLERIGDHAALIAGWVVFSITGTHKEI